MNHILDSKRYSFVNTQEGRDTVTILSQAGNPNQKVYRNSGKTTVFEMDKFMANLTESQCDQVFKNLK